MVFILKYNPVPNPVLVGFQTLPWKIVLARGGFKSIAIPSFYAVGVRQLMLDP